MSQTKTFWWTPAPFLRLLPALALGIAAGWYAGTAGWIWVLAGFIFLIPVVLYPFLPLRLQYPLKVVPGCSIIGMLVCLGALLVQQHDVRNKAAWFGKAYQEEPSFVVLLAEPLVAKANSWKAIGQVQQLEKDKSYAAVQGSIILYFKKALDTTGLRYGSRILLRKPLQPIQNSGNPGAFDYQRYCLFQGITHQVFLAGNDFRLLPGNEGAAFTRILIQSRQAIVGILRRYISGPLEQGLAEALLIGYKDDLDKGLVQAYANTGVVHVIAISGLHLGLIYGLLLLLLKPLRRRLPLLHCLLVVCGLWAFSLLAGAQPSVLRSAVMFSCLALGELLSRRAAVLNTLALSAFGLLCYNPFWLWDLGFQLSYAAVFSIVVFYKPLYQAIYFPNRAINHVWQLAALTLTAQVFTLPISLYHFHQFPLLFLLTNLVAVPLSSLILLGEIALCALAWWPALAISLGKGLHQLITWMNSYVLRLDGLSIAVWDGFALTDMQLVLLFVLLAFAGYWVLHQNRAAAFGALWATLLFSLIQAWEIRTARSQQSLLVYHTPRLPAADFISGQTAFFRGDPQLLQEGFARNFHLKPARTLLRIKQEQVLEAKAIEAGGHKVLFWQQKGALPLLPEVLVVSGRTPPPRFFTPPDKRVQVVLDASVSRYRRQQWHRFCDSLRWPIHDVQEQGAFVMQW
ncbi:competence protein ComEC [Cnuella takakiae]|uniref:Competence protein ComEC n=1 Tax=Cnuella takakiae TaxID=1302690 RepID=A0A1M5D102_9BACT|nr:ComEC/Rec2 family competence protein [Cnuella takakiae]OLY94142.1 hypothetical protein BUE76_21310 [Cnuella takakiae]SHF60689.1 competence protein ComEC [Cnuella takakiae]